MTAPTRHLPATLRAAATFALFACAWLASLGCARPAPYVPTIQIPRRVAVLDFAESDKIRILPNKEVVGWWFGGHDRVRNENIGEIVADELQDALSALPYLEFYSRLELKYYIAARRDALESAFKRAPATPREIARVEKERARVAKLRAERGIEEDEADEEKDMILGAKYTDLEYDKMIDRIDPVLIGRDLDVDYVVSGYVREAYFARNRTIHWPWSRVEATIEIHDVRTGKQIYFTAIDKQKSLITPERMMNDAFHDLTPAVDLALASAAKAVGVAMDRPKKLEETVEDGEAVKPATKRQAGKPAAKPAAGSKKPAPAKKPAPRPSGGR